MLKPPKTNLPNYAPLLIRTEEAIDSLGWDQEPALYVIIEQGPGDYSAMLASGRMKSPPDQDLFRMSCVARQVPANARKLIADVPEVAERFRGYVFTFEGWTAGPGEISDEEIMNLEATGRGIADHLAATEVRNVLAVDIDARMHMVERIRGKQPTYECSTGEDAYLWGGLIPGALRNFTLAIAQVCPQLQHRVPALEAMQIDSVPEMLRYC